MRIKCVNIIKPVGVNWDRGCPRRGWHVLILDRSHRGAS